MKSDVDSCQTETQSFAEWPPRNLGVFLRSILPFNFQARSVTWNVELTSVSQGALRAHRGAWRLRVKNSDLVQGSQRQNCLRRQTLLEREETFGNDKKRYLRFYMEFFQSVAPATCLRGLSDLFKIRALRQELPIAVQFQFGVKRARIGDLTSTKISVSITWYHLVSVNSPLYARDMCAACVRSRVSRAANRELRSSPALRDVSPWQDAAHFSREACGSVLGPATVSALCDDRTPPRLPAPESDASGCFFSIVI